MPWTELDQKHTEEGRGTLLSLEEGSKGKKRGRASVRTGCYPY